MKRLSFGARGLKNREEMAKENENGDMGGGGGTCALVLTLHYIGEGSEEPPPGPLSLSPFYCDILHLYNIVIAT